MAPTDSSGPSRRTVFLTLGLAALVGMITFPAFMGRIQYARTRAELAAIRDAAAGSELASVGKLFTTLARVIGPAVVNVTSSRRVLASADEIEALSGGSPHAATDESVGSGVIIDPEGTIVTNYHVVARSEEIVVTLADGRKAEVMFSRQRLPLGTAVALEEFVLTSHIGGFTGSQGSIRDYMSAVRFKDVHAATWSEPQHVSVNEPVEHDGLWYFQAQWDPPDMRQAEDGTASAGLNYTVLGVGNRVGVHVQLAGCCIAVLGMIYAFYVKPVIKRRRQDEVLAGLGRSRDGGRQVQP